MTQEKPWWDSEEWLGSLLGDDNVPFVIPELVREAERRGREKALEEVRSKSAFSRMAIAPSWEPEDVLIVPKSFFES